MKNHQIVILVRALPRVADDLPGGPFVSSRKDRDESVSPRAEKIGPWLRDQIAGRSINSIRHGPEKRCRVTAEVISQGAGRRVLTPSETYLGRDWGSLAGARCADVRAAMGELNASRRRQTKPGSGESWLNLEQRLARPITFACSQNKSFALVADQSVCRAVAGILVGPKFATDFYLENGGYAIFESDGTAWRMVGEPTNPPKGL